MALYQKIEEEMKAALKGKDEVRLSTLRLLLAAVKTAELEKPGGKKIEESEILQIIQRQVKQHKESIEQFKSGNRPDLVEKETRELKILESYLPEQMKEEDLLKMINETIKETGAGTKADMGKIMKLVMEKARGRADGKLVKELVMRLLK